MTISRKNITSSRVVDQLRGGIYLLAPGIGRNYKGRSAVLSVMEILQ